MTVRRSINERFDDIVAHMTRLDGDVVQIDDPREIYLVMMRAETVSFRLSQLAAAAMTKGEHLRMRGAE